MLTDSDRRTGSYTTDAVGNQKGSIFIEFVFAMTILLVMFMAAVTFSFLFSDYYGVQKAAKEGAREASLTGDIDWARTKAYQSAWLWGLDQDKIAVEFYQDGTTVTCYVTYTSAPFHRTFPTLVKGKSLNDVNMSASAISAWLESR